MTPEEMKALGDMLRGDIKKAVDAALRPVVSRIEKLEATDRKHSGVHRELGASVRQSSSDLSAKVNDTTAALSQRDQQFVTALNGVRDELAEVKKGQLVTVEQDGKKSMMPAAPIAAEEASKAARATAATRVASDNADKQSLAAKVAANKALIAVIVQGVALGLWQAYLAIAAK